MPSYFTRALFGLSFIGMSSLSFADNSIVIKDNQIINKATTYKNQTINLTQGEFTIKKGGSLTIENSVVNVTISPTNPYMVYLTDGTFTLKNTTVNVTVSNITPDPNTQALFDLIHVDQGIMNLNKNNFTIDTNYTVGLLITNPQFTTSEFNITDNSVQNFHGGIYLLNSNNAEVNNNNFLNVSYTNIFNNGDSNNYKGNTFTFPGSLQLGDAIDIINSDGVSVSSNVIASSSNYGIYIMGGQDIFIDDNKITDGMSYGIFMQNPTQVGKNNKSLAAFMSKYKLPLLPNNKISITNNYLSLNRYGISGDSVQNLTVEDNTFIQRFATSAARTFWTNNDVILPSAINLVWLNNLYKEAFTQENGASNSLALQFVTFPAHGGVSL